jgi:uncharacterized protein (TIGR01777 family)
MDVVIHLAGRPLDEQRWTQKVRDAVYASRVRGADLICRTLARLNARPRLLISASATDCYADSPAPIGEPEGRPGKGYVPEMCRDWEAATAPARDAGIRVVSIRIPSVPASVGHSILAAFLPLFRLGLGPVLGSGKQLMCFIARDDLIRAIEHIMACDQIVGPVNGLAPAPVTNEESARTLGRIPHRPAFLMVPAFILRLVMGEVAEAILGGRHAPQTREAARKEISIRLSRPGKGDSP